MFELWGYSLIVCSFVSFLLTYFIIAESNVKNDIIHDAVYNIPPISELQN